MLQEAAVHTCLHRSCLLTAGPAHAPSSATFTLQSPQKKRRGRPPGSKNKPKPQLPSYVGHSSIPSSHKQPLVPAPVFRPTPDPGEASASQALSQPLPGVPLSSAQQQLLAAGINLPVGPAMAIHAGRPISQPNHLPMGAVQADAGGLQHQPAMPHGAQGPASIPQSTSSAPALPAAHLPGHFQRGTPLTGPKKRGRPLGSKNKPKPFPKLPAPGKAALTSNASNARRASI